MDQKQIEDIEMLICKMRRVYVSLGELIELTESIYKEANKRTVSDPDDYLRQYFDK